MELIKTIPIGTIYSFYDNLCEGLDDAEKVHGCYRNIRELLIRLAEFYLSGCSGHEISWFGQEYTFSVSVGEDGASFDKNDVVSHLLFGANCTETCLPVQRFIEKVCR